ncbi:hypothetical protein Tco_0365420 [Tanacetum coccineum]
MIAIRMKKFYKKTGRRVRVDGKTPGTHDGKKKRDSLYQHQEAGKQEKNQMGLLTMDDGIVNWGEHTEAEESNHALMAISSSNMMPDENQIRLEWSLDITTCRFDIEDTFLLKDIFGRNQANNAGISWKLTCGVYFKTTESIASAEDIGEEVELIVVPSSCSRSPEEEKRYQRATLPIQKPKEDLDYELKQELEGKSPLLIHKDIKLFRRESSFVWTAPIPRACMLLYQIPRELGYKKTGTKLTEDVVHLQENQNDIMLVQVLQSQADTGRNSFHISRQYVAEITQEKFDLVDVKAAITMETKLPLTDEYDEAFDVEVCVCSRFQVTPKTSHLNASSRGFQVSQGQTTLGVFGIIGNHPLIWKHSLIVGLCWIRNRDRKSTQVVVNLLDKNLSHGNVRNRICVALQPTEAEYEIAAANCSWTVLHSMDEREECPRMTFLREWGKWEDPTDGPLTFGKSYFAYCFDLVLIISGRVNNFSKLIFDGNGGKFESKDKVFDVIPTKNHDLRGSIPTNPHHHLKSTTSQPTPAPHLSLPYTTAYSPKPTHHLLSSTPTPTTYIPTPTPPPIPTPTPPPITTPIPIPDTEPTPDVHIYEEQSPIHHHFSPTQEQATSQLPMDDLLHEVPKLE